MLVETCFGIIRRPRSYAERQLEWLVAQVKNKKPEYATPHRIMGEAIEKLQGCRKEVYLLVVRDEKSLEEAALVLEMDELRTQKMLDEAIEFVRKYCKQAIAKGRV